MMNLSNPPIGLSAVEAFYDPIQSQLVEADAACGLRTFHITGHKKAMPNILAFFEIVNAQGLAHLITSYDGCYVNRPKRLSSQLSMHGRGAAFDINAATNPQGDAGGDMPAALVNIAKSLGFFWGGDFKGEYVDRMHFQLGVDFALGDRSAPAVTYHAETSAPAPVPTVPPVNPYRTVKAFSAATGALLGQSEESGLLFTDGHAYIRATALAAVLGNPVLSASLESGNIILKVGTP